MARLSQETIEKIFPLYLQLGTYTAVATKLGISASTVSKYVKLQESQVQPEEISSYSGPDPIASAKDLTVLPSFLRLTPEEFEEYENFIKELKDRA